MERDLLGLAIKTEFNCWYIPVGHEPNIGIEQLNFKIPADLFVGFEGPIYAHNMKFDFQVLVKHGIFVPTDNLWCTMMMSVYINENHKPIGHDLDAILNFYLGQRKKTVEKKALEAFGWMNSPVDLMAIYAEQDVSQLLNLADVLHPRMEADWVNLWENVDRKFMLLLSKMELRGIPIDYELCEATEKKLSARMQEIVLELGFDPGKQKKLFLYPKLFDPPPVGLGLSVPSRTPKTNEPQVTAEWLETIGHPMTALLYEYSKLQKQNSSYYSAYRRLTTRAYPRLHPSFKQHGAETGRLSCANPNLQQIPRDEYKDAYVKKLFVPDIGYQLWEIDYRTIEYRLAAVYAQDVKLLELFENEGDFHQLVADDVSAQVGFPVSRQQAKTINYLMGYGGGVEVLKTKLRVDHKQAKKIHQGYKAAYWKIFERASEATEYAEQNMEIQTWSGRTRHFRFQSEAHKAFNACMQGGAFEIVKTSMLKLDDAGFDICNQVHDSVWIQVKDESEVIEAEKIMSEWTTERFGLTFRTDRKRLN